MTSLMNYVSCITCNPLYDEKTAMLFESKDVSFDSPNKLGIIIEEVKHCSKSNCKKVIQITITSFSCERCYKEICNKCLYYSGEKLEGIVCEECLMKRY